ncbi:MAG: hypothetical protein ACSHXH_12940 [Marivita sp.]|uniref:hypothetical protein n=1 Tax=Marivita sp. TaxID=2003365 RepID=UPI003EF5E495
MTQKTSSGKTTAQAREDRLKTALKANMAKRKAQARARSSGTRDEVKDSKNTSEGS